MASNEIEHADRGTLEILPPVQAPSTAARAMLREHAQMMNDAYQLAKGICGDGRNGTGLMVPQRFRGKPEEAAAAMIYGSELGLNPLQAVQRVVPIHGMPSLESRTMVGLLKSRGYAFRTVEQSDKVVEIWGWEPTSPKVYGTDPDDKLHFGKRINPDAESRWTIERAIQAGYVPTPVPGSKRRPDVESDWVTVTKVWDGKPGKTSIVGNMKYITDPQTMLKAKGQAEVSRELAPDVLMGISYTREELESEDQRQFDRADERGAAPARTTSTRVTEDQIFAEEVPLSADGIAGNNPPTADEVRAAAAKVADDVRNAAQAQGQAMAEADQRRAERDGDAGAPEAPAGDVTEDQGEGAPDPKPSPAVQTEQDPVTRAADLAGESAKIADTVAEADETEKTAKKVAAKRSTAPTANPDKPKTRMRQALEKRLFALLGDAGIAGEKDRDGRLAVYRAILEQPAIGSTDDLDDPAVGKVADQLYAWSQQNELDDQIAGILSDAARAESDETAAPAADSTTSEGNNQ